MGGSCTCRACAFLCPFSFLQQHQQCGPREPDSDSPAVLGDGGIATSPWQSPYIGTIYSNPRDYVYKIFEYQHS